MMNGIKIMNLEAGEIFGYINGTRKYYGKKDAVLSNSLLSDKLIELGMNVVKGSTRDIVSLSFNFGSQDAEGEIKRIDSMIKDIIKESLDIDKFYNKNMEDYMNQINDNEVFEKISLFNSFKNEVVKNKDKYLKLSSEKLREKLYTEGFELTFKSYPQLIKNNSRYSKALVQELKSIKADNTISKKDKVEKIKEFNSKLKCEIEKIKYKMLFRSPAKARVGSVIFCNEKLYNNIYAWMTMDLKLPNEKAKIVEMAAYSSLVSSTIQDKIYIPVEDILIVKDVDSFFATMTKTVMTKELLRKRRNYKIVRCSYKVKSSNINEIGMCVVKDSLSKTKCTLWDGMSLIESSVLGNKGNGMALLRQHFFKSCAFKTNIQLFFQEYYGDRYENVKIFDMFGNPHDVKNIKLICTNNSIKWLKFADLMGDNPYEYWCSKIREEKCEFGICKTDHKSKLSIDGQVVQQMSYQMINTLPIKRSNLEDLVKYTVDYVNELKDKNDRFIDFLDQHKNITNINEMLIDLYKHNNNFANSTLFRSLKSDILGEYKKKIKRGKILTDADNLTICGSPYALLLYVVGEDIKDDKTLPIEKGVISCYTPKFKNGEYLCAFRSPHNSPNNVVYLHNQYSDEMERYFDFSENIIAVNCQETDIQDRGNGLDEDSDAFYVSNDKTLAECARIAYEKYPTIVNGIKQENKEYNNYLEDYAKMDNALQKAKAAIGISSNLAMLAMSYYWTENDEILKKQLCDNFVILSVLAQVSIDNAKRAYSVNLDKEIKRISKMQCMKRKKPSFWKSIKKKVKKSDIDFKINCPMNWLVDYVDKNIINASTTETDNTLEFIVNVEGKAKNEQMDKILRIVKGYDDFVKEHNDRSEDITEEQKDEWFEKLELLHEDVIKEIGKLKITDKTLNRLIIKALTDNKDNYSSSKYRRKLLNVLYQNNKKRFLDNFIKGECTEENVAVIE